MRLASAILIALVAKSAFALSPMALLLPDDEGLVAHWWPSIYGTADDISGNGNHGSLSNGTTITENGFLFNGTSWVEVGNRSQLSNTSGAFTATAWFSLGPTNSGLYGILNKGKYSVDDEWSVWGNEAGGQNFRGSVGGLNSRYVGWTMGKASASNWHFCAMTCDGVVPPTVELYLDGVKATVPYSWQTVTAFTNRGGRVTIGAGANGTQYFVPSNSVIDDVRFYRGAWSKDRIDGLMWRTHK